MQAPMEQEWLPIFLLAPGPYRASRVPFASSAQAKKGSKSLDSLVSHYIVSILRSPSTAGRAPHTRARLYKAGTRVQVWCPLQALPPLGLPSTSANMQGPRAGKHALPPLEVAVIHIHVKCSCVCHARSLMSICRAMLSHALLPGLVSRHACEGPQIA